MNVSNTTQQRGQRLRAMIFGVDGERSIIFARRHPQAWRRGRPAVLLERSIGDMPPVSGAPICAIED
jgi:hypothetical protein